MAFIKVGDTVINTDHIIAVELDRISIGGKCCVVISLAAKGGLFKRKPREFWFDGEAATKLRDYFENPDNVTQLLPSSSPRSRLREKARLGRRSRQRSLQHLDFNPEAEITNWDDESLTQPEEGIYKYELTEDTWDDEWSDPPDEPPPRPNIGRRPWKQQPPDPLSTATSVEFFNPPIP